MLFCALNKRNFAKKLIALNSMKNLIKKYLIFDRLAISRFLKTNGIPESVTSNNHSVTTLNIVLYLLALLMILPVITALLLAYVRIF